MRAFLPLLLLLAIPLRADEIVVSAAASTREALSDVTHAYEANTHDRVLLNFGGSNEMARQIIAGAKVDVFIAADEATMKRTGRAGRALMSNRLAIVTSTRIANARELTHFRRIAMANWRANVPAGVYARDHFVAMKLWDAIEPRVVPTVDVRAALAAYDSGAVDAAVVYVTDSPIAKRKHATLVMEDAGVVYPAAIIRDSAAAKRFFAFLFSDDATRIFTRYGFTLPKRR